MTMPPDVCDLCAGPIPMWDFFVAGVFSFVAGVLLCGCLLAWKRAPWPVTGDDHEKVTAIDADTEPGDIRVVVCGDWCSCPECGKELGKMLPDTGGKRHLPMALTHCPHCDIDLLDATGDNDD